MEVIDIIIILPVLWGVYKGFSKGLVKEIATLIALIIGIYGAMKFYGVTQDLIVNEINMTQKYLPLIAFGLTFIGIIILINILAKLLDKLIRAVALGFVNRIAGAIFGGLKYFLIVAIFLIIINKLDYETHFLDEKTKTDSVLFEPTLKIIYSIFPSINKFKQTNITPDYNTKINV